MPSGRYDGNRLYLVNLVLFVHVITDCPRPPSFQIKEKEKTENDTLTLDRIGKVLSSQNVLDVTFKVYFGVGKVKGRV